MSTTRTSLTRLNRLSVLRNKDGIEVSIPNIIVAIIISLVVIASVVAGVVFLIPFAQNSSAKGDLQTVQSAEQIYYAQAAPPVYGGTAQLVEKKALVASPTKKVAINVSADGQSYCAGIVSAAKGYYWVSSGNTEVQDTVPDAAACPTKAQIDAGSLK